jgi:hypothetical protein
MSLRTILILLAALLLFGGGLTYYMAGQEPGPLVAIHKPAAIGLGPLTFEASVDSVGTRLTRIEATLEQQGRTFPVFSLAAPGSARFLQETPDRIRITREFPAGSMNGLKDGTARLTVTATRQVLRGLRSAETIAARDVTVRITRPAVAVVSTHHYVKLGGAELVVYRVSPPDASSGVQVGDRFYPGFPAAGVNPARQGLDAALRVAFFGLLYDQDLTTPIRVVARDVAGNEASAEFDHKALVASFDRRTVPVDDAFLTRVVPAILTSTPDLKLPSATPKERLAAFLTINRELRQTNEQKIIEATRDSAPEMLWTGTFLRMGGASSEAVFADHRTYKYNGREIDAQVHLGVDLASVRGAPIKAANTGRVIFAGSLGIYGNCVILDHGVGVQSLYAHLSTTDVEPGDRVERGETIGHSGMTGLAGGDHLHFSMLLCGRPVNPIEWWDPHWIADRVTRKLVEAGLLDGSAATPPATSPAAKAPPKKKAPARAPKAAPKPAPGSRKQ